MSHEMASNRPKKTPPPLPSREYPSSTAANISYQGGNPANSFGTTTLNNSASTAYQSSPKNLTSKGQLSQYGEYGYSANMVADYRFNQNQKSKLPENSQFRENPMFKVEMKPDLRNPSVHQPLSEPEAVKSMRNTSMIKKQSSVKSSAVSKIPFLRTRRRRAMCLGFSIVLFAFATFYGVRYSQATSLFENNAAFRSLSVSALCSNNIEYSTKIEIDNSIGEIKVGSSVSTISTDEGVIAILNSDATTISVGKNNLSISGTVVVNSSQFNIFQGTIHKWLRGASVNVTIAFNANVEFTSSWFLFPLAVSQQLPLTASIPSPFGLASEEELDNETSPSNSSLLYNIVIGEYDPLTSIKVIFGLNFPSSALGEISLELPPLFFDIYIDNLLTGTGASSAYTLGTDSLLNATVDFSNDDIAGTNHALKALLVDYASEVGFLLHFTNQTEPTVNEYCFIRNVLDGGIVNTTLVLNEPAEEGGESTPTEAPPPLFGLSSLVITNFGNLFIGGKTFVQMRLVLDFTGIMSFFRFEGNVPALDLDIEINTTGPNQWKTVGTLQSTPFQLKQSGSRSVTLDVILEIEDGKAQNFIEFLFALPGSTKPFIQSHPLPVDLVGQLTEIVTLAICACINTYI